MEIPGYEIIEKLGEGGTATVWKARQIALDRLVALKILNHALAADEGAAERFRTEGLAAAKLSHRNIVQVFDAGEVGGVPYFAMEFVEGESLGDIIARKGRMQEAEALAVAESVALGLKNAWDRAQIIHCDIKPDNILIESYGVVKVADLGLARILSHREGQSERDVIGTPNYVSPEQAAGGVDLDYRSDIYSLGATLYHMVTGAMPFSGARGADAMDMHQTEFLPDPMEVNQAVSPNVAMFIEKLMVRNRGDRYASWTEVLDDVEAVTAGGMPLPPIPEPGQSTVSRSDARNRVAPAPVEEVVEEEEAAPAPRATMKRAVVTHKQEAPPPRAAVTSEEMRRRLDRATAAATGMQSPQKDPAARFKNLILQVAIAAAISVLLFWMWQSMTHKGSKPKETGSDIAPELRGLVHAPDSAPATTPAAAPGATSAPGPAFAPVGKVFSLGMPAHRDAQGNMISATTNSFTVAQLRASLGWQDPEYQRACGQYNGAIMAYVDYQEKGGSPVILRRILVNLRNATEYFEKCKDRAPMGYDVARLLLQCKMLIDDVNATMSPGAAPAATPATTAAPAAAPKT